METCTVIYLTQTLPPHTHTMLVYYILDEMLIGGELLETSKREGMRVTTAQDKMMADGDNGGSSKAKSRRS